MLRKIALAALFVLLAALPAFAAGDWSRVWKEARYNATELTSWQYRTGIAGSSADLDTRMCESVSAKWDPSVSDSSFTARGAIYACPSAGAPESQCRAVLPLDASATFSVTPWETVGDDGKLALNPSGPFLRLVIRTAPVGGDIVGLQIDCASPETRKSQWKRVLLDDMDHTVLNFRHKLDVACSATNCTPNDPLTPTWIRTAINGGTTDTLALDSAVDTSGQAILDPGTAANTGAQFTLPASQALVLDIDDIGRLPGNAMLFEATFWRTGTTVIPAIGLCPISAGDVAVLALSSTGTFANAVGAVKWDAAGTFTARWGTTDVTSTEAYLGDYHTITIRTAVRNVNEDLSGLFQPKGFSTAANEFDTIVEIDGLELMSLDTGGAPFNVATNQISPCISAVNVGGTADSLHVTDLQWHTSKIHAHADAN